MTRIIERTFPARPRMALALCGVAMVALACTPGPRRAPIDDRTGQSTPAPQSTGTQQPTTQGGIRDYGSYQSAVARNGETVSDLAGRVGLSASELGAYNGLSAGHTLAAGDELVLPPRPGGYGTGGAAAPATPVVETPSQPSIEATPLDGGASTPAVPEEAPAAAGGWSPELAAAAIDRATGIDEDGNLAAPPSANDPLPENPTTPGAPASPDLSQYQTQPVERPQDPAGTDTQIAVVTPTPNPGSETATDAVATPQPAPQPAPAATTRLQRPVQGPIAVGFRRGTGAARNDGVDFASPAGSPVLAADDGEVALVSQSLGGLGTIVLLRHGDELLTVYGRIDDVSLRKGELVRRGQQIGTVASPPSGSEARMHFEVRRGAESLDPTLFIAG
ncbi:MAG: LysM peptidoglycan-binding domain-containing M23 family metallopeptidase [Pseudomonadota bacterium]